MSSDYIRGFEDAFAHIRQEARIKAYFYLRSALDAKGADEDRLDGSCRALFDFQDSEVIGSALRSVRGGHAFDKSRLRCEENDLAERACADNMYESYKKAKGCGR